MPTGKGDERITGKDQSGGESNEADRVMATAVKKKYGSIRATLPSPSVDVDVITLAGGANLFANMTKAHHISIFSTEDVEVRLNLVGNDKIFITAGVPFPSSAIELDAMFFSNSSGNPATLDITVV